MQEMNANLQPTKVKVNIAPQPVELITAEAHK